MKKNKPNKLIGIVVHMYIREILTQFEYVAVFFPLSVCVYVCIRFRRLACVFHRAVCRRMSRQYLPCRASKREAMMTMRRNSSNTKISRYVCVYVYVFFSTKEQPSYNAAYDHRGDAVAHTHTHTPHSFFSTPKGGTGNVCVRGG